MYIPEITEAFIIMCRFTNETMSATQNMLTVAEVVELIRSTNEFVTKITQPVGGQVFVCKNEPGKLT